MLPHIDIFGRSVSSYGAMCILGITLSIFVGILRAKRTGVPKSDVFYVMLLSVIGLLAGGKLLYVLSVLPLLWKNRLFILEHPELLKQLLSGGYVFYGGIAGAVLVTFIYCKKYKLSTARMLDTVAPGIPLAHAFGRLGCLSAGCCYGCLYHGPFALVFPEGALAPAGIPLFPSQLLESVLNFALFVLLMLLGRRNRRAGVLFGLYHLSYSVIRFVLEFFRGDTERGVILGLSLSQWISVVLIPLAIYLVFYHRAPKRD
jgi:phosphatidylglycerol:prolipoprotein diacylglycerol transferase